MVERPLLFLAASRGAPLLDNVLCGRLGRDLWKVKKKKKQQREERRNVQEERNKWRRGEENVSEQDRKNRE